MDGGGTTCGYGSAMSQLHNAELVASEQAMNAGMIGLADVYVQQVLMARPDSAPAWNLAGKIATKLGLKPQALGFFDRARAADRYFKAAEKNRALAEKLADRPAPAGQRYLLIREWGAGFWSDVEGVLGHLLIAEICGRTPLVYWGPSSLFASSGRNAWELSFSPVSGATIGDAAAAGSLGSFPDRWKTKSATDLAPITSYIHAERWEGPQARVAIAQLLATDAPLAVGDFTAPLPWVSRWIPPQHPLHGRSLDDLYRYLVDKYLHPAPQMRDAAAQWHRQNIGDAYSIAVHVRLTDKPVEVPDIVDYYNMVPALIAQRLAVHPEAKVFVMTDTPVALDELRAKFPGKVVHTDCTRNRGETGVHFLKSVSGESLAREVMLDSLVATMCNEFLGSGSSNVACMISRLKQWDAGTCTLRGLNLQQQVHGMVFTMPTPHEFFLGAARREAT
jgi:hypothetical protein